MILSCSVVSSDFMIILLIFSVFLCNERGIFMARRSYGVLMTAAFVLIGTSLLLVGGAGAHCQIPCGIYDHNARLNGLLEDVATIEKSVKNIQELSGKTDPQSQNQLVRWVVNKETHANYIQETVADYFLAQVVKPADPSDKDGYAKYLASLADHHAVIVWAMKAKQTADLKVVESLRAAVKKLEGYYSAS